MRLTIPTLDEVATNPRRADGLPVEALVALAVKAFAVQAAVAARVAAVLIQSKPLGASEAMTTDRLLTPQEAAVVLGVTRAWLYRHAGKLPFTRRLSRKTLRFSQAGLCRWQALKQPTIHPKEN
jgi:excisionase family DNA binding protein